MEARTEDKFIGTLSRVRTCENCDCLVERKYTRWDGHEREYHTEIYQQCNGVREPFKVDDWEMTRPCKAYKDSYSDRVFTDIDTFVDLLSKEERKHLIEKLTGKEPSKKNKPKEEAKPSITKEEFVSYINFIKERGEKMFELNRAFTDEFEDSIFYPYLKYEAKMVDLLRSVMHDKYDDIDYFIYELNFGEKYEDGMIREKDGTLIDFSTAENVYDYLVERFAE